MLIFRHFSRRARIGQHNAVYRDLFQECRSLNDRIP